MSTGGGTNWVEANSPNLLEVGRRRREDEEAPATAGRAVDDVRLLTLDSKNGWLQELSKVGWVISVASV